MGTTTYTTVDPTGNTFQKGPVHSVAVKYREPMGVVWEGQGGDWSAVILYADGKDVAERHCMPTMERALEWMYREMDK